MWNVTQTQEYADQLEADLIKNWGRTKTIVATMIDACMARDEQILDKATDFLLQKEKIPLLLDVSRVLMRSGKPDYSHRLAEKVIEYLAYEMQMGNYKNLFRGKSIVDYDRALNLSPAYFRQCTFDKKLALIAYFPEVVLNDNSNSFRLNGGEFAEEALKKHHQVSTYIAFSTMIFNADKVYALDRSNLANKAVDLGLCTAAESVSETNDEGRRRLLKHWNLVESHVRTKGFNPIAVKIGRGFSTDHGLAVFFTKLGMLKKKNFIDSLVKNYNGDSILNFLVANDFLDFPKGVFNRNHVDDTIIQNLTHDSYGEEIDKRVSAFLSKFDDECKVKICENYSLDMKHIKSNNARRIALDSQFNL